MLVTAVVGAFKYQPNPPNAQNAPSITDSLKQSMSGNTVKAPITQTQSADPIASAKAEAKIVQHFHAAATPVISHALPNLILLGYEIFPIGKQDDIWSRMPVGIPGGRLAWLAFIRNAPLEDTDVGTARVRAEIIYYPEGHCISVSPATWLDQSENTACLKSGDTKDLLIAVEIHPQFNWTFLINGLPCNYGDLWATRPDFEFEIRLIDDETGKVMKPTYCFKWEWRSDAVGRPRIRPTPKIEGSLCSPPGVA